MALAGASRAGRSELRGQPTEPGRGTLYRAQGILDGEMRLAARCTQREQTAIHVTEVALTRCRRFDGTSAMSANSTHACNIMHGHRKADSVSPAKQLDYVEEAQLPAYLIQAAIHRYATGGCCFSQGQHSTGSGDPEVRTRPAAQQLP